MHKDYFNFICMLFQLLLNAEGTRFTPSKHAASQKFAVEHNLPILKHHLTPRTKGFIASLPALKAKCPAIYDIQLVVKPDEKVRNDISKLLYFCTTYLRLIIVQHYKTLFKIKSVLISI